MAGNQPDRPSRTRRAIRECIAIAVWVYVLVKSAVYDIDIYLVDRFAPQLRWILEFKAFVILAVIALCCVALSGKSFFMTGLYIGAYPVVVVFRLLPMLVFKQWPVLIVSAPVVYRLVTTFRATLLIYTAALFSGLAVFLSGNRGILAAAAATLFLFIVVHLVRSFRKAYAAGAFFRLALLLSKLRASIAKGTFDGWQSEPSGSGGVANATQTRPALPMLYFVRQLADIVDEKVRAVASSRKYDFWLVAGWLYTVALTCVAFAFVYMALYRIDHASFKSVGSANLWAFLGFSLGALTPAKASAITPASPIAALAYYAEAFSSIIILVILVFTVLTAARETFRHDVEVFGRELQLTAGAIESRIAQVYSMTLAELEALLVVENQGDLVNLLRKARGLPELPLPPRGVPART
jgi:hypothetical protein